VRGKALLVEQDNRQISITRQAELLGIARSTMYYKPIVDEYNLKLMRLIDEQHTKTPFYGSRKMKEMLRRKGHKVNRKRVQHLMRIEAIYPKRNLSRPHPDHKVYPYLLRNQEIEEVSQVWSTDLTYIRMRRRWLYLVAIMDWMSRYVISFKLSTTLEVDFCIQALEEALEMGTPKIFSSDQGSQFTSISFLKNLKERSIQISMDGRGRAMDNVFTERLWRSLKYKEVYINDYESVCDTKEGISRYINFYNRERPHQSLGYRTPAEVYFAEKEQSGKWDLKHDKILSG